MGSSSCEVDPVTGSEESLGALLEDEHFLLKVLAYVVEDGLHECRLVCRQWRDACGKLPVELGKVSLDNLQKVADLFPEAKTLSMRVGIRSAEVIEIYTIPQLLRLENLNHLSLFLHPLWVDSQYLIECFSSMQHLRFLRLRITCSDTLCCLIDDLHYLKNLTSLRLDHDFFLQSDLEPNSDVRGLRHLEISLALLVNGRGELILPSLTRLTSLICIHDRHDELPYAYPRNLQVCQRLRSPV